MLASTIFALISKPGKRTQPTCGRAIAAELEQEKPDLDDVEVPQSEAPGQTTRFVLYNSHRNYLEQMESYLAWREGTDADDEGER